MRETPAFTRDFPESTSAAVDAFARGDFGTTRRLLAPLLTSDDATVRAAAENLRERMKPPLLAVFLLAVSALLLLGLAGYWTYKRGHG